MVLALLAVLVAPLFIDWSAYRADFEREAGRILGQPVAVRGPAVVRILPFPSVTFGDIEVGGEGRPMLTARSFRMDAELAPYLSGELRIFSMRLEAPRLDLGIGPDGRFTSSFGGGVLPTNATVVLEDVSVSDGVVTVTDARAGRSFTLSDIQGAFAARSLAGPLTGGGTLRAEGRPLAFQLSTGTAEGGKGLPAKLTLDDNGLDLSTTLDGALAFAATGPRFEGTIRTATLAPPKTPPGGADAPQPAAETKARLLPVFTLTGKFAATAAALDLSDARLAVGAGPKPYILTGSAGLTVGAAPEFRLDLAGEQLDIDALAAGGEPKAGLAFAGRLEAARSVIAAIPRPALPGTARLSLPVVVAGDTTIRDLVVEAAPRADGWSVRRFAAELPGRTRMEAAGELSVAQAPGFRGSLLVAARQPTGFAEWLTGGVDPAIRTLAQAGFSADVDLSPEHQSFRDLEVDLGGASLAGSLDRSGAAGERVLAADLKGGRLDLDAFVALSRLFTGETDSIADARRGSLKLAAGPVAFQGIEAGRVDADLAFDGHTLAIERLDIADLAGSALHAKGSVAGLGATPSGRMEVSLASERVGPLLDLLAARLPPIPILRALRDRADRLAPLSLSGMLHTVPGTASERPTLNVDLAGTAAATEIGLSMLLGNGIYAGGSAGRFGLDLALTSAEPPQLLGQIGFETLPLPVPSPLGLKLALSAGATGPVAATLTAEAPGSHLSASGELAVAATGIGAATLAVSAGSDDAVPWLLATGNAFGAAAGASLPATFAGDLGYDGAALSLKGLEGSIGATDFSAELERRAEGPVTGEVFVSDLSVPWLAGLVYGQPPADPARPGAWNAAAFGHPLLPATRLALDVTADQVSLGGSAALGDASAHLETTPDSVTLSDLRGTFGGGYGAGLLQFRNANGVGAFSATADLQGLDLGGIALNGFALPSEEDAAAPEAVTPPPIAGTLDAALRLDGSGQSYAALLSAMTGAGKLKLENGAVAGLKPDLLPDVLKAADVPGFDPTPANVAGLVARQSQASRFPVPALTSDFSVAGGVARFPALRQAGSGEVLTAEGALDLARATVAGTLRLDLDPGDDAVEGAAPAVVYELVGPVAGPRLVPDAQPLANYLSIRALEREQARVEAIQGALQEKLRLRREARLYRWRAAENAAAAAEVGRSEDIRRREGQAAERSREAAEVEAEARAAQERLRDADAARGAAVPSGSGPAPTDLDLELSPTPAPVPPAAPFAPNLPGVRPPSGY
ncbi:hypothetical protein GCM10011390_08510 [Aureimonas endophytica]|uniref:AsmA family protein n=1 Tax=Aureimonas endophytica TaxID=2027858 RepID=A0A917E284_9HYPH|nr:AsmA-like C-terminal region-containing protein [Aureimonas endophytica]GGD92072.1 hypothetical protein GCM10011390_08510 [Aureimonas endophytica]